MSESTLNSRELQSSFISFDQQVRRVVIDGELYWSVLDTYRYYGRSGNPSRDWKRDKAQLEEQGYTLPKLVTYVFVGTDGKNKMETPIANLETFLRIAQVAKFKEWEHLRQWMVDLTYREIRGYIPPRQDSTWRDALKAESVSRQNLMDALDEAVYFMLQGFHYEEAADTVLLGLYNRTKAQIKLEMGLVKSTENLKEFQPLIALSYQAIAQDFAARRVGERSELSWNEAIDIIYEAAKLIGEQVQATSRALGIDVATGKRLLTDGSNIPALAE